MKNTESGCQPSSSFIWFRFSKLSQQIKLKVWLVISQCKCLHLWSGLFWCPQSRKAWEMIFVQSCCFSKLINVADIPQSHTEIHVHKMHMQHLCLARESCSLVSTLVVVYECSATLFLDWCLTYFNNTPKSMKHSLNKCFLTHVSCSYSHSWIKIQRADWWAILSRVIPF